MDRSDSLSPSAPLRFLRSAVPSSPTAAAGPPRFLGNPPVRAVLFDPGGSPRQTIGHFGPTLAAQRCCLPLLRRRRPPHPPTFEAQSHGPYVRCLRFAATVARCLQQLRKTRFRLVVLLGRTGFEPAGLLREVSASVVALHRFLLTQAFPGAPNGSAKSAPLLGGFGLGPAHRIVDHRPLFRRLGPPLLFSTRQLVQRIEIQEQLPGLHARR